MKSIQEIKKYHEDCAVICRGTYSFVAGEWKRDEP